MNENDLSVVRNVLLCLIILLSIKIHAESLIYSLFYYHCKYGKKQSIVVRDTFAIDLDRGTISGWAFIMISMNIFPTFWNAYLASSSLCRSHRINTRAFSSRFGSTGSRSDSGKCISGL